MIRRMTEEDIDDVIGLEMASFSETLGREMFIRDLTSNILAYYYVYTLEDKIVGYISVWALDDKAEILNFCVDEKFRKKGIGNELLNYILNILKDKNVKTLTLEVRESNENAIALYTKNGFIKGYIRYNYYKNTENAIVMIREL